MEKKIRGRKFDIQADACSMDWMQAPGKGYTAQPHMRTSHPSGSEMVHKNIVRITHMLHRKHSAKFFPHAISYLAHIPRPPGSRSMALLVPMLCGFRLSHIPLHILNLLVLHSLIYVCRIAQRGNNTSFLRNIDALGKKGRRRSQYRDLGARWASLYSSSTSHIESRDLITHRYRPAIYRQRQPG